MQLAVTRRTRHAMVRCGVGIVLFSLGTQVAPASTGRAPHGAPEVTDRGITAAIEGELRSDKGVSPDGVDVSTAQGTVTLSGTVNTLLAKRRTATIAESIRGVQGVIDRTSVTPVSRPDQDIRKAILRNLRDDPATEPYQISVTVSNGIATLTGHVASNEGKTLAGRIAEGVKGLKDLRNNVTVQYFTSRTDEQIDTDIEARLAWDIWLNGDELTTAVKDGHVTLRGRVGSAIGRSRAFDDAWVTGVATVDDTAVKIEPRRGNDARHQLKDVVRSDAEITRALEAAFRLDPRVAAFAPDVTVEGGGVILGGTVDNLKAKAAAEQDAHDTMGVWRVDNFLKVRPKGSFVDADAEKQLKTALAWDPLVDSSTIDVAVINRVVYLSGAVDSRFARAQAEDLASRVKGVVAIRDHLKVEADEKVVYDNVPYLSYYDWPYESHFSHHASVTLTPAPYASDEAIKKDIESSMFWSPFVNRDHIKVAVHGGVATLTGTVGSWIGWREADKDARKSAGDVINRVVVKKSSWWW